MSTRAVTAAEGYSNKPLLGKTWSSSTAAAAAAELAADELDDKEFVSKETLNRRQDKKLIDDITSVLYRLELDSVKPSEYVMELTGNHRRRQAAASARGKGSKPAAPAAATGAASKTSAKSRQRPASAAPLVAEPAAFVPDPDVIYTATGVKSLKKGKDANEDQVTYYKTLLDELYKRQTGRLRDDDQKKQDKDESAAALAAYVTLPRSWRHFDEQQQKEAAAAAAEAEHKRRPDERLITVSDLPYGDGSKLLRYATLDDIKSRHVAPSTSTPSSYASPRSWSMVDFVGGDEELLSYLYNEPEANVESEYRRDVIRPLERPAYRTSDYTEQMVGRQRSTLNGGYSSGLREYSSSYRVPYSTPYIL